MKKYYIGGGVFWSKKDFQRHFDGSTALFEYCWKKAIKIYCGDGDLQELLEYIATETVNNEKSKFYIYG